MGESHVFFFVWFAKRVRAFLPVAAVVGIFAVAAEWCTAACLSTLSPGVHHGHQDHFSQIDVCMPRLLLLADRLHHDSSCAALPVMASMLTRAGCAPWAHQDHRLRRVAAERRALSRATMLTQVATDLSRLLSLASLHKTFSPAR